MIGIAVSFYDKFEDFGVLVDIIRNNWRDEYYIVACSNHPDADTRLEKYDIDEAVQGSQIEYNKDMAPERQQLNITCRILDQFQKVCRPAIAAGCDKVMHLKADAWPLDEERVLELTNEMDDREKKVAIRGNTPTYRRPRYWLGSVMDQFLLFDADYAESVSLLDYDPLDLVPHTNIHTSLSILLIGSVGISNIWYYSRFEDDQHWDGKSVIKPFTGVRPSIFNPTWGYVHVAVDEFPREDLGRDLQAIYLKENNITKGEHVQRLLSNQSLAKHELFQKLAEIEKQQDRKLKWLGFRPITFGRMFQHKQKVLDSSIRQKIKMIIKNVGKESYYRIVNFLLPDRFDTRYPLDIRERNLYRDSEWPEKDLHELYEQRVYPDDFPEENRNLWFKNQDQ